MLGPRKRRTCGCHSYYLYTFFLLFFFLHIRPVENVRHGGVMLRDCVREQQQKKGHDLVAYYELTRTIPAFFIF